MNHLLQKPPGYINHLGDGGEYITHLLTLIGVQGFDKLSALSPLA
jgi:hypothetical protein